MEVDGHERSGHSEVSQCVSQGVDSPPPRSVLGVRMQQLTLVHLQLELSMAIAAAAHHLPVDKLVQSWFGMTQG